MSPLKTRLLKRIAAEGPMNIASFMGAALFDPTDGFYPTRDPLGADGDFITAPEISQMFGEMIGLWCVQSWRDMGRPDRIQLIELGPGRGIMMSDILRAAKVDKAFLRAVNVTLIEASPALEMVQGQTLTGAPCPVSWAGSIADAPLGPSLIIGNEFLDCLPIRQFVKKDGAFFERVVAIDPNDKDALIFALSPAPDKYEDFNAYEDAEDGALVEICPGIPQFIDDLTERFTGYAGRALMIDYGPARSETGDSLQALKKHTKADPLAEPGDADLTARVDFEVLAREGNYGGLAVFGPLPQAEFLRALGLEARAALLTRSAPGRADVLARQTARLTADDQMGQLFKAICLQSNGLPDPPGFEA